MQLGMIGLGRMGSNLVRRLTKDGHACVVYDVNATSEANYGASNNSTNTFSNSFSITDLPSVSSLMFKINGQKRFEK